MSAVLTELLHLFCCPDDGSELRREGAELLRCVACPRAYPVSPDGRTISLVSSRNVEPPDAAPGYLASYRHGRNLPSGGENWRIREIETDRLRKRSQVSQVEELLSAGGHRDLVCDFSAGPGYYTLHYASRWRHVIHCDLSSHALQAASEEASARGVDNVLFVRMDYLSPPFRASLRQVICMDSLERGPRHEQALLASIRGALVSGGTAIVDFHNWWHNPLRRLGLMQQNFGDNRSYRVYELPPLLAGAGIKRYERFAFHQELAAAPQGFWRSLAAMALPPTRWVYRFNS